MCFLDIKTGILKKICVWFTQNFKFRSKQWSLSAFWLYYSNKCRIMMWRLFEGGLWSNKHGISSNKSIIIIQFLWYYHYQPSFSLFILDVFVENFYSPIIWGRYDWGGKLLIQALIYCLPPPKQVPLSNKRSPPLSPPRAYSREYSRSIFLNSFVNNFLDGSCFRHSKTERPIWNLFSNENR